MQRGISIVTCVVLAVLASAVTPAAAETTTTTSVTMVSEAGDAAGAGKSRVWYPGAGRVSVSFPSDGEISVSVEGGSSSEAYAMSFVAPEDEALTVGHYENAERTGTQSYDRPGMQIYGDGGFCSTLTGDFTIRDIGPDRLWLTYEQHCGNDQTGALFGEVRYNLPGGDPQLLVSAGRVVWPATYPGTSARVVPVVVANVGAAPVDISSASVSAGVTAFEVEHSTCGTLLAGDTCTIYLGFKPTEPGPHPGTLTIEDSTAAGTHSVALAGQGIAGVTSWWMSTERGDSGGEGTTYAVSPIDAQMRAIGDERSVEFHATSDDVLWHAYFSADSGHLLLPGTTFRGASESVWSGSTPGMHVPGGSPGCSSGETGTFTVEHARYEDGRMKEIAISYEESCDTEAPTVTGLVQWHVAGWKQPDGVDQVPPAAVSGVKPTALIGAAVVTWTDPDTWDWARTVVRGQIGGTPPSGPDEGVVVYAGRLGRTTIRGLVPATDYSYAIFAEDTSGLFSRSRFFTLFGTDLSVESRRHVVHRGRGTWLTVAMTDSRDAPVLNRPVQLYQRAEGAAGWQPVRELSTGPTGTVGLRIKPTVTTRYRVVFHGEYSWLGSESSPVTVRVK